jgi:hypothetical protein
MQVSFSPGVDSCHGHSYHSAAAACLFSPPNLRDTAAALSGRTSPPTGTLKGFDAVQLAVALTLRSAVGARGIAFSSFDRALCWAAAREGLVALEPRG